MGKTSWWNDAGPFQPWNRCPSRPDPGMVLRFYLERRGIRSDEQVGYLMKLLKLQKSMVYHILQGEGFDLISRNRLLVRELALPPTLLGIDGKYFPIEKHPLWWRDSGFSFNADSEGYPVMSEVVACLRRQMIQMGEGGGVKSWSQQELGDATDLRKEIIYRIEHNKNPLMLEHMSRRALVASALGAFAGEQEPTIFRLFGLDPLAYRVQIPAHERVPVIDLPYQCVSDEVLQEYQQKLADAFTEYATSRAQDRATEAQEWVKQLFVMLSRAETSAKRVSLLALQSRAHRLLACVARDQCEKERILFHTAQALVLAEQTVTLLNPTDQTVHTTTNELLASALFTSAMAFYELDEYERAQKYGDRALELLPNVLSRHLKAEILAAAALIHACTATSPMDQQKVLSYLRCAMQTHMPHLYDVDAPDENFFQCSEGKLLLYKAWALSSPKMEGVAKESVQALLNRAQRLTDPLLLRQQVLIEYLQARSHFVAGSYKPATEMAHSALAKCRRLQSRLWKQRLEALYQRLLDTPVRDKPLLVSLGIQLRMWDYEVNGI